MNISAVQSAQDVYKPTFAQESPGRPFVKQDRVNISGEARELAKATRANEKTAASNPKSLASNEIYPVEAYALPSWFKSYIPEANILTTELNDKFWGLAKKLTEDNYLSDEERSKLRNYLDNDPFHQAELEKTAFREEFKNESEEYFDILLSYFSQSLSASEISSTGEYYQKVILDKTSSEKIHQDIRNHLENDSRALELMDILGIAV